MEIPESLVADVYKAVEIAAKTGKVKKGVNETTKALEREKAKFVVIAGDVSPKEITMHLPLLSEEKKVPYVTVPSKAELGKAAGIKVPTSSIAILEEGDAKDLIKTIVDKLEELNKEK